MRGTGDSGVNRQTTASLRLLSLIALAAGLAVVVVQARPHAGETTAATTPRSPVTGDWLASSAGRLDAAAPLARRAADLKVRLGGAGVIVRSGSTKLDVATLDVGKAGPWRKHANGIVRPTSFGRETITVGPSSTEIFLRVDRHQGQRLWSWRLGANLRPVLVPGGSVLLRGTKPIEIAPVKIYDAARTDVTPKGAHWKLTPLGKTWRLDLQLDDAKLLTPYVIDPEFQSHPSYRAIVTGDGASLMTLDDGNPSLVQNIPSNSSHGFNGSTDQIALGSQPAPSVIEVWFSTTSNNEMPFYSNRDTGGAAGTFYFGIEFGRVFAFIHATSFIENPGSTYNDGQPHQAVFVNDGGTGKVYVDGALMASGSTAGIGTSGPASIGHDLTNNEWFSGSLDEFATYGGLTAAQVLNHYQVGSDSTPPTLTVTGQDGNGAAVADGTYTQSDSASFTFTAGGDTVGTPECSKDGAAFAPCDPQPIVMSGLSHAAAAGDPHTFAVRVTDAIGNRRTVEIDWFVDQTAPVPSITTTFPTPAGPRTQTVTFTTTPSDPSTWQCKLDAGAFAACGSGTPAASDSTTLTGLTDGSHTITVHAVDRAGNPSSPDASATWTVDGSSPNVTVTAPRPGVTSSRASQTITLRATDVGPAGLNTATRHFTEETGPLANGTCAYGAPVDRTASAFPAGSYSTGPLADATCYRYVYSIADNANPANTGTAQVEIKVDSSPPAAGSIAGVADGAIVRGTVALSDPTASDSATNVAQVRYETRPAGSSSAFTTLANAVIPAAPPYSYSWDTTAMAEGSYELRATVIDAAGNSATTTPITVTVDNSGPTASVTVAAGTTTASATTDVTFAASDPHGPLANPVYSVRTAPLTNGACGTFTAYGPLAGAPAGPTGTATVALADATCYQFRYTVEDAVGNTSDPAESGVLSVDQTPPAGGILISPLTGSTVPRPITFNVTAQDNQAVASVVVKEGTLTRATLSLVAGSLQSGTWSGVWTSPLVGSHTLTVVITDIAGGTQLIPLILTVTLPPAVAVPPAPGVPDTTPPSAPRDFAGQVQSDGLHLQWGPATDNSGQIGHYFVWIDGVRVQTLDGTTLTALIGAFAPDDHRIFQVDASDPAGNVGPFAPSLTGVPSVTGQELAAARTAIAARGFTVGSVTQQASSEQPGTVIAQAPSSPGVATVGSGIDLTVSQQGGQAQLVMEVTAARRVLLSQRNFIAVRVSLTLPSSVKGTLRDRAGRVVATWQRSLGAGATIVRLTLPKAARHTGVYRLTVDAAGGGQAVHKTIAITLVGPAKAKAKPTKRVVSVMLVDGPDLRNDIAINLNQRFSLQYAEGPKAFAAAEGSSTSASTVSVAVIDVTAATLSVIRDLHLVFPQLRIIAVVDSTATGGRATAAGASLVLTKPTASTVLAAAIRSLSNRS